MDIEGVRELKKLVAAARKAVVAAEEHRERMPSGARFVMRSGGGAEWDWQRELRIASEALDSILRDASLFVWGYETMEHKAGVAPAEGVRAFDA